MFEANENYLDAAGAAAEADAEAADFLECFFFIGFADASAEAAAAGADAIAEAEAAGAAVCEPAKAEAANKPTTKAAINFFILIPL